MADMEVTHGGGSATSKESNPYLFFFFFLWGDRTTSLAKMEQSTTPIGSKGWLDIFMFQFFKFLIFLIP
jgi:hypothetical protein